MGQQSLLHPPSAALAGIHPTYILLGFSAALAPKFPPLLPVVESGSSNSEKSGHDVGFVSDSLVLGSESSGGNAFRSFLVHRRGRFDMPVARVLLQNVPVARKLGVYTHRMRARNPLPSTFTENPRAKTLPWDPPRGAEPAVKAVKGLGFRVLNVLESRALGASWRLG